MFKICEWSCLGHHSLHRAILQELNERTESLEQKAEIIRELNEQILGSKDMYLSTSHRLICGMLGERLKYSHIHMF